MANARAIVRLITQEQSGSLTLYLKTVWLEPDKTAHFSLQGVTKVSFSSFSFRFLVSVFWFPFSVSFIFFLFRSRFRMSFADEKKSPTNLHVDIIEDADRPHLSSGKSPSIDAEETASSHTDDHSLKRSLKTRHLAVSSLTQY